MHSESSQQVNDLLWAHGLWEDPWDGSHTRLEQVQLWLLVPSTVSDGRVTKGGEGRRRGSDIGEHKS